MSLNDLSPAPIEFKLNGKYYHLRVATLEDYIEINKRIGNVETVLSGEIQWIDACKIAYIFLEEKDQFLAEEKEFIDNEGFKQKRVITGPEKLFKTLRKTDDIEVIVKAIEASVGFTDKETEETEEEEVKKK